MVKNSSKVIKLSYYPIFDHILLQEPVITIMKMMTIGHYLPPTGHLLATYLASPQARKKNMELVHSQNGGPPSKRKKTGSNCTLKTKELGETGESKYEEIRNIGNNFQTLPDELVLKILRMAISTEDSQRKGPSIYHVRKILGFFDPSPLSAFGTDLQY